LGGINGLLKKTFRFCGTFMELRGEKVAEKGGKHSGKKLIGEKRASFDLVPRELARKSLGEKTSAGKVTKKKLALGEKKRIIQKNWPPQLFMWRQRPQSRIGKKEGLKEIQVKIHR